MPTVIIPPPYRGPTKGAAEVAVEGSTVRACLEAVEARHPGFGAQLFDAAGALHRFVKVFHDGELVDPASLDGKIAPGGRLEVIAAIAGG